MHREGKVRSCKLGAQFYTPNSAPQPVGGALGREDTTRCTPAAASRSGGLACAAILMLIFFAFGCSSLKQMEPNQWNITMPMDQDMRSQGVWFGIGGALPWGKQ